MKGEDFPAVKFEVRTGYTSCMSMPLTEGIIGFSIKSCCQVLHNMSDNLIRVHGSKMYKPHVFSIPPHRHRCNLGYHSHLLSPRTLHVSQQLMQSRAFGLLAPRPRQHWEIVASPLLLQRGLAKAAEMQRHQLSSWKKQRHSTSNLLPQREQPATLARTTFKKDQERT